MSRHVIGFDIETAPQPLDQLSARQRRRYELLVADELKRNAEATEADVSEKVRSLHPMLGWICCISLVRSTEAGERRPPKSYTASRFDEEAALLEAFWSDLAQLRGRALWVSFNGKRFDADWLRVRSAAHGIAPTRHDILDRYPWRHTPHCDLSRVFECRAGLDDLCDLLGVPSPKAEMCGAGVAQAVSSGRLDDVARYCELDVTRTLDCYFKLAPQL